MSIESLSDAAAFVFQLNGQSVRVADTFSPQTTLLDFLRGRGLTGAKEGCAEGECGACTVVMVKTHALGSPGGGSVYLPVNSCLIFLPMAADQEIYTVEALAASGELNSGELNSGELNPVQRSMVEFGGSQCGYCTPGFVMSLFAEHYRPGREGPCDPHALSGNLCRCTGYRPIRDAALALGQAPDDAFKRRLAAPAPRVTPMASGDGTKRFSRPASLQGCMAILTADPEARLIAGGTDLGVESNLSARSFPHLVSLEAVAELRIFHETEDHVEIGAGLSLTEVGAAWRDAPRAFSQWLSLFASPLIRNRATLGGNLATASPIGDAAPLLLALDARLRIASQTGPRNVPLHEFYLDYRKTVLAQGEILVSVIVPKAAPPKALPAVRFYKVAKRRLDDISTVAAAFSITLDGASRVRNARLAYGGVAAVPKRCNAAEAAITGRIWNQSAVADAQAAIAATLRPIGDHRGSAEYRLALAQSLFAKFYHESSGREFGGREFSGREFSGHESSEAAS